MSGTVSRGTTSIRTSGGRCGRRRTVATTVRSASPVVAPRSSPIAKESFIGPILRFAGPRSRRRSPAGTTRADTGAVPGRRTGRASPSRRRPRPGRPAETRSISRRTSGWRCRSRTCSTTGPWPATPTASGARTTSGRSPHGTSPTAIEVGVVTWATVAPVRSGSGPSTSRARRAPASCAASSHRGRPRGCGREVCQPVDPGGGVAETFLREDGPSGRPRRRRPVRRARGSRPSRHRGRGGRRRRRGRARRPPPPCGCRTHRPCRGRRSPRRRGTRDGGGAGRAPDG